MKNLLYIFVVIAVIESLLGWKDLVIEIIYRQTQETESEDRERWFR